MNIPPISTDETYVTAQGRFTARGMILMLAIIAGLVEHDAAIAGMGGGGSSLADSFETVAANLDASGSVLAYSGGDLVSITYANGVIKSFAYGPDGLASVTLSGVLPSGIDLIKTLTYTGGELTAINYS